MSILGNLQIVIDKTQVMDAIQCYKNNPGYEETLTLYDELLPGFKQLVKPAAGYVFMENSAGLILPAAEDCSKLVYCAVTLGQPVCDKISEFFNEGSYLKATLLNAMADELLVHFERVLYLEIKQQADIEGYGLTRKITPITNSFEETFQQDILMWFNSNADSKIEILADYTVQPIKSAVYLYGADTAQLTAEIEHDCIHCDNISCSMREHTEPETAELSGRNNNWPDKVRIFFGG